MPQAMDFRWQSLDGKEHTLSQLAGRPVVIHFWASWCAPCRTEFPKLLQASTRVKEGTVFLTISSDEDKAKAQQFIRKSLAVAKIKGSIPVYYAFDPTQSIAFDTFQTVQYPETVFLDSGHHLRRKIAGVVDWDSAVVHGYLSELTSPSK